MAALASAVLATRPALSHASRSSLKYYLESEALTPILHEMVTLSALPLKGIESDFAVDSTGFSSTQLVGLWQQDKYARNACDKNTTG